MCVELTDAVRVSWLAPPASYMSTDGRSIAQAQSDVLAAVTTPGSASLFLSFVSFCSAAVPQLPTLQCRSAAAPYLAVCSRGVL
jgi:hypothetical protein